MPNIKCLTFSGHGVLLSQVARDVLYGSDSRRSCAGNNKPRDLEDMGNFVVVPTS